MGRRLFTFHGSRDLTRSIFRHVHPLTRYSYPADEKYEEERSERKAQRKREKAKDRKERDEYYEDSEDEFKEKQPMMLEAPSSTAGAGSEADFIRENRDRRRERDGEREVQYSNAQQPYNMSGGLGRRDDGGSGY